MAYTKAVEGVLPPPSAVDEDVTKWAVPVAAAKTRKGLPFQSLSRETEQ